MQSHARAWAAQASSAAATGLRHMAQRRSQAAVAVLATLWLLRIVRVPRAAQGQHHEQRAKPEHGSVQQGEHDDHPACHDPLLHRLSMDTQLIA